MSNHSTSNTRTTSWQADDCPDAHGFTTIRRALAGSPHGDTESQPIATVYDDRDVPLIVEAHAMLEALRGIYADDDGDGYTDRENMDRISAILARIDGKADPTP